MATISYLSKEGLLMADIGVPMHSRSAGSATGPAAAARHHRLSPTSGRTPTKAVPLAAPAPRFRLPEVIVGALLVAGSALGGLVWRSLGSGRVIMSLRFIAPQYSGGGGI